MARTGLAWSRKNARQLARVLSAAESERRIMVEILEKKEHGEKLTEREARMLDYSLHGTAARSLIAPVMVHTETERWQR